MEMFLIFIPENHFCFLSDWQFIHTSLTNVKTLSIFTTQEECVQSEWSVFPDHFRKTYLNLILLYVGQFYK